MDAKLLTQNQTKCLRAHPAGALVHLPNCVRVGVNTKIEEIPDSAAKRNEGRM